MLINYMDVPYISVEHHSRSSYCVEFFGPNEAFIMTLPYMYFHSVSVAPP